MSDGDEVAEFGPFRLHVAERFLERNGALVKLGSRSLDLLIALVAKAGEVLSHRELIASAWPGLVVDQANLRVNIASLRKYLADGKDGARYIVNVPGRGYSFVAPVVRAQIALSPRKSEAIRTSDPRYGGEPHPSVSENSLPKRFGRLIGRDTSVNTLIALLTKHRFVSIIGPGGMGKTTVAIPVAHAMLDAFGGAVYYVDFASVTDPSVVPSAIASVLGLKAQVHDPKPGILAFLSRKRTLLVLDNCEHLINEIAAVAEWLYKSTPQTHLLATSREWLRVEGEHVHILPPLDVPPDRDDLTASDAMAFPAVQLFMERAAASGAQGMLSDEMVLLAVDICRKMDGIALAIELAAGRARSHGLRGTAELINSRFNLLWQGRRTAPLRHQTLQAVLDWSYNLLSETERCVLCRLSIVVGPFELAAAQWIAADAVLTEVDVSTTIVSLIDKSLVSPSILGGSDYLRLLDMTRTYASQKLVESGEVNLVSRRLAEYLIAQFSQGGDGEGMQRGDRVAILVGNMRTSLAWAFSEAGDEELGVRLAALAAPRFLGWSLLDECYRWCQVALSRLGSHEGSTTHLILQEALAKSALYTRVDRDELRNSIEIGLSLARTFNDHERELGLLAAQHIVMCHIGYFREAVDVGWRSLDLAQRARSPAGIVMSEWMLGCAYHFAGDQAGALRHSEEGFKQAAAHGIINVDLLGFAHRTRALIVLARALWLSGAVDRAARVARQTVEESEPDQQPMSQLVALMYSSTVFLWRGDLEASEELVGRLMQHADRHPFGTNAAFALALSGEVALLRGEAPRAVTKLREALSILQVERRHNLTTLLNRSLAAALLQCGDVLEAEAAITAAMDRAEAEHESFSLPELMRTRAKIGLASGRLDPPEAEAMLRQSLELAKSQSAHSFELRSAMALGELLASAGRTDEAYTTLGRVYGRFTEGSETRDLRAARQLMGNWRRTAIGLH